MMQTVWRCHPPPPHKCPECSGHYLLTEIIRRVENFLLTLHITLNTVQILRKQR